MKPNKKITKIALWVLLSTLILSLKLSAQDRSSDIPLNIRQCLDKYCVTLSEFAKLSYDLYQYREQDSSGIPQAIKNAASEFASVFSRPDCMVVNDFVSSTDKTKNALINPGISITSYLNYLDRFSRNKKVSYNPDKNIYGFSFDKLSISETVTRSNHTIYLIKAEGFIFSENSELTMDSLPLTRFFTFISYHPSGFWSAKPKICRIAEHQEPIHQFYPYQIFGSGITNTGTVQFRNITDTRLVPYQGGNLMVDFRVASFGSSIILLNTGLQFEKRSFGLAADSYFDSALQWKSQSADTLSISTLYTSSVNPIKHNLSYQLLSVPVNLKIQKESNLFFFYAYGGIRLGGILDESYGNLVGSVNTTDSIIVAKNDKIIQKYFLSNIPQLGLKEYTAPQIQKESFFKTLSFGYQLGAGGGIKVTRQLRVGANIEYNQCFFSPKAISVDAGYLKPLNYSTSAFSMASVHGKIGLFYTLQDAARPFYSVRDHIITPPENKQKDRLLELQYDLTALASDSLNIKRIQYLVQDTASKTIYQKGFIKTRKAGKLRIGTPEGASLIIVKPPGFDLVTTLPAESLRNMLLIKIPNLMEHDSLTVIARALKPLTFYALYIGDGDSIKLFQDRSFRKICQSGSTAGSKWALIERYKNVFVPIDSAGACSSLEYIIRSDPEESGSFVEKLYKALHSIELFNRKVELIVLVNTKDAFIQYIVPAVRDFQEMSDVYENWKNVRIQVFTGFNLKELQGQIGIIERGWNIKQLR